MGTDGIYLLDAIWSEAAPSWLRQIEAVEILRQVWIQQFYLELGSVKLREASNCPPSAILINSFEAPSGKLPLRVRQKGCHSYLNAFQGGGK